MMRVLNYCFIFVFMTMLLFPLIFVDLSSDRISVQENRKLAERPKLSENKNHLEIFFRQFDAWFKDSTGFREQLLSLYNVMGFNKMSGTRYTKGDIVYLVGEKRHHFLAGEDLIQRFQGKPVLSDEQLAYMANKLEEIKVYLDKRSIPFIVMFCSLKEEIYPEYYPKSIKRGQEPILLEVITKYIKENTNVDIFNIRQALLAEKDIYMLYPVSSGDLAHYNEIAAFFAYRELMKHINIFFPNIIPFELDDIEINNISNPVVFLKAKKTYKELDLSFFDDIELIRPFSWENVAYENTKPDLPLILFFRDSYASEVYFGKYIAQQFGKTIYIHYSNLKNFDKYVDRYKPDIIVFESVIPENIASYISEVPELVIKQSGY